MTRWIRDNRGFLTLLFLFGIFRTAVADWNPIPSGSMHPTLLEGDVVFVNRLAYDLKLPLTDHIIARLGAPARGDVVTFSSPVDNTRLIKRIVAIPGDTVEMHDKVLVINGTRAQYQPASPQPASVASDIPWQVAARTETVAESSHTIQWLQHAPARDSFGPVTLGADQYWMLGDNRDNSADSRYIGLVPREKLIGKAVRVLVSVDILGNWLPRWDRLGQSLG
jgi:signal peptidase I